jgi:V8-like Glu-specific endopeptidase
MSSQHLEHTLRILEESFGPLSRDVESLTDERALMDIAQRLDTTAPGARTRTRMPRRLGGGTDFFTTLRSALQKQAQKEPILPHEAVVLEAVVAKVGRPALLVEQDDFEPAPNTWAILEYKREEIRRVLPSVGRIEFTLDSLRHIGTGFLVGEDIIMTNRHVVQYFAREADGEWSFIPFTAAQIDFDEEYKSEQADEFRILNVLGSHPHYDLALVQIKPVSNQGNALPAPLSLKGAGPDALDGGEAYVVGYPAKDEARNDPEVLQQIFADIYDCKRLQPGRLRGLHRGDFTGASDKDILFHDCSTLGGNSGACLVEVASSRVIGLHFGGLYGQNNYAVPLWQLAEDSFFKGYGLHFA